MAVCPMDARTFDDTTDYAGAAYDHPSTRRDYCSERCRAGAARERQRERGDHRAQRRLQRDLAALEAAGQQGLLTPTGRVSRKALPA